MKKKKLLSVLLAGAMSASIFVGCGSSATDWDYISNKGEFVIGVTYFEPMNYLDADGKDKTVVAEKKSAGETVAQTDEFFSSAKYVSVDAQAKALLEVKSGTADVAVIDYVMSIGTLKSGSDYADLKVVDGKDFSPEQYGIALRKDSPETLKKLNDAIQAVADDGTLDKIAEKYSLQDLLLVKKK